MTTALSGSVGLSGRNLRQDTIIVQTLLKRLGMQLGLTDGLCGPKTQSAIIRYQSGFMRNPDGLVEPEGMTWRHLTGQQNAGPPRAPPLARRSRRCARRFGRLRRCVRPRLSLSPLPSPRPRPTAPPPS
jgi:peptidoglycan hydrolase-like protein with peptidoglycan-binding domain